MTMRKRARRVTAGALAIAALGAMVVLSRVSWRSSDPDVGELRLSWRVSAPSQRSCRPPTEDELSGVLPHMRPTEICTDTAISFRLAVRLNGETLHSAPVERSGPRARRITVHESFALAPGDHALEVDFLPEPPPEGEGAGGDGGAEIAMTLSTRVTVGPRQVILVGRDENGGLFAVGPPRS